MGALSLSKVTKEDKAILNAMSNVSGSIVFRGGKPLLYTTNERRTVYLQDNLSFSPNGDEGAKYPIYNLKKFISYLSLFDEPSLTFSSSDVSIVDNQGNTGKYQVCDIQYVQEAPNPLNIRNSDVTFKMTSDDIKSWNKSTKILDAPQSYINAQGIHVEKGKDCFTVSKDIEGMDLTFEFLMDTERLQHVVADDYTVHIDTSVGLIKFEFDTIPGKYYLVSKDVRRK